MKNLIYNYTVDNYKDLNKKLVNILDPIEITIGKGITYKDDYDHCSSPILPNEWQLQESNWEKNVKKYPHIKYKKIFLDAVKNKLHDHAEFVTKRPYGFHYQFNILHMWYHQMIPYDNKIIWHNHQKCQWSGIYFVEVPDNKYTEFFDLHTQEIFQPNVKEGDIIIFPSWMYHKAPEITDKHRTVIVWNMDIS